MQCLIEGSRVSYQGTVQNLKRRGPLCAEDWWLFHHKSNTRIFFQTNCFHSIDLTLFTHQFRWCVEHLFHCEIFCILDGMPIVWVILSNEYRWLQCWRHEHFPYHRMFFVVFCCFFWGLVLPCNFIEDRFCLFRTWSFILSKNDLDPDEKSNSVPSSPMTICRGLAPLWGQTTGFSVLSWFSSSPKITCLWFYHPSIHQLSTLEKAKLCRRPILRSLLSTCFQWLGGGGLEPLQKRLVIGLDFAVTLSSPDDSTHHVWNSLWLRCLRVGFWC